MKKVMIVLGFIILFIGLIACSKDIEDVQIDTQGDYFLYPMNETIYGFDVDKNGVLIYSTVEDQGEVSIKSIHGEEMKKKRYVGFLYSVDFDGNKLDTYELGEDIHANRLVIDGDKVVFSAYALTEGENGFEEGVRFYELTLNNKMTKVIYNFLDIDGLIKFEFIDDFIYFLGTDNKNIHKEYTLASNEDDYVYNGEVLGYIDTTHETWVEIPVEFPISFSKTADSNLLIYAHDNKGYYFIE